MDPPVYRSLSIESSSSVPTLSLDSQGVRSLTLSQTAPPFSKGGPDFNTTTSVSTKSLGPVSLSSVTKSIDSLSFSSTKSPPQSRAAPIGDCPLYYEPNSSFLTNKTSSDILDSIRLQLVKRKIIHQFFPLKHKIKGLMYSSEDSAPCTFKISLFKAPKNTKKATFLVEIQRRYGCIVLFRRFYQQILQALTMEGAAIPILAASTSSTTSASTISLDKGTIDALFRSLGSPSKLSTATLENLRETMRIFATISKTTPNKMALVSTDSDRSNLLELILNTLQVSDFEVRRCGATLLSNMATVESLRSELIPKLTGCMFKLLENTDDSTAAGFTLSYLVEIEIQRQIAQALATITQTHGKDLMQQPDYSHYLEILNKQKVAFDELFRESVQKILQQLTSS